VVHAFTGPANWGIDGDAGGRIACGWEPEARGNALNTVRSALTHLAAAGEIERVRRGVYQAAATLKRDGGQHDAVVAAVG
jgi:hypothetical protein